MSRAHHLSLLLRFDRGLSLKEAVAAAVKKGDVVVDAGCGTGILSMMAVRAGAERVIAVDNAHTGVARELAKQNQVADKIEFIQADLAEFKLPAGARCDVLLAMLYFNDPRRDMAQTELSYQIRRRVLRSGGRQIPDRIIYKACPLDWPSQDINSRYVAIDQAIDKIELHYGLTFQAIRDALKSTPDASWFPQRQSGVLKKDDARLLSSHWTTFTTIDYSQDYPGYPKNISCDITQPGICNAVLFTQYLFAGNQLIFSNESVSWVRNPMRVDPGIEVTFALDDNWFESNVLTVIGV